MISPEIGVVDKGDMQDEKEVDGKTEWHRRVEGS